VPVEPEEAIVSSICANCTFTFTGGLEEARKRFREHKCAGPCAERVPNVASKPPAATV
jgi:hypothetical protein